MIKYHVFAYNLHADEVLTKVGDTMNYDDAMKMAKNYFYDDIGRAIQLIQTAISHGHWEIEDTDDDNDCSVHIFSTDLPAFAVYVDENGYVKFNDAQIIGYVNI